MSSSKCQHTSVHLKLVLRKTFTITGRGCPSKGILSQQIIRHLKDLTECQYRLLRRYHQLCEVHEV